MENAKYTVTSTYICQINVLKQVPGVLKNVVEQKY